jgi:hypothetical protein
MATRAWFKSMATGEWIDLSGYLVAVDLNQGDRMTTRAQLERRLERLEREAEALREKLLNPTLTERLERLSNCAVIRFTVTFHPGSQEYDYAAIKTGGRWSTTGPRSPKNYSSAELADWLESTVNLVGSVLVVSMYREIEELTS